MRLKNKIALITGAAAKIGEATAELFVREGATVVVADLDSAKAAEVAKRLGDKATPFTVDVSKSTAVKAMMGAAGTRHGVSTPGQQCRLRYPRQRGDHQVRTTGTR